MDNFRLDRTKGKGQTANGAAQHAPHYHKMTWQQRLAVAAYLNSVAYNYPLQNPPKMDKSRFKAGVKG
ncbi:MAG: hypothetical protein QM610_00270 [Chitinophagaceae bacterium]